MNGPAHMSEPINFVFLAFLWCPSLAVYAETSLQSDFNPRCTSSFLFAPSWSSFSRYRCPVLPKQAPNEAKPLFSHTRHARALTHTPDQFSGWCCRPLWCKLYPPSVSVLHISLSASLPAHLLLSSFPPLKSGTTTEEVTQIGWTLWHSVKDPCPDTTPVFNSSLYGIFQRSALPGSGAADVTELSCNRSALAVGDSCAYIF